MLKDLIDQIKFEDHLQENQKEAKNILSAW
jgi:hypothetical protein